VSARAQIRPALEQLAVELRRRGVTIDVAMLRVLRDFGLTCHGLGVEHAHTAPTIPVPADDGPDRAIDDVTGRYAVHATTKTG
jgi:hypothetical protein